jgi:uncharacterized protein YndB with AHSA1/START domain
VTEKGKTTASPATSQRRVIIERTYQASIEELWNLWTTREGIESWWGPEGFVVKVRTLDLRPGGELRYAMTATGPEQIEFMKKAGMPLTTEHRGSFTEVVPRRRLAFSQLADFIPGVQPYDVATTVEFHPSPPAVRLVLTIDAMHDEHWTQLAVMGWESELGKLAKLLEND